MDAESQQQLRDRVREILLEEPDLSWDTAVWRLANEQADLQVQS